MARADVSPRQPYLAALTDPERRAYHLAHYYWNQSATPAAAREFAHKAGILFRDLSGTPGVRQPTPTWPFPTDEERAKAERETIEKAKAAKAEAEAEETGEERALKTMGAGPVQHDAIPKGFRLTRAEYEQLNDAYSADTLADKGTVRATTWRGKLVTNSGGAHHVDRSELSISELIPLEQYKGETHAYGAKRDEEGIFEREGTLASYRGKKYVLHPLGQFVYDDLAPDEGGVYTPTLADEGYDFKSVFPRPHDEEMNKAGRQGMLDQKEDDSVTDGAWIGFQHEVWRSQIAQMYDDVNGARADLAKIAAGKNPQNGKPFKSATARDAAKQYAEGRLKLAASYIKGYLDDYENYFGTKARDAFARYVQGELPAAEAPAPDLFAQPVEQPKAPAATDLAGEVPKPGEPPQPTKLTGEAPPLLSTPPGIAPPRDVDELKTPTEQLKLLQRRGEYTAVDEAAAEAAGHLASKAQQDAGNYQKGHVQLGPQGATMEGAIETAAGESRRPEWPALVDHYGYFKGTIGFDKDHLDFFIPPGTPATWGGDVYVVNQTKADNESGGFDEHKIVLGAPLTTPDIMGGLDIYLRNYEPGWSRYSSVVPMTWRGFRLWATDQSARGPKGGELTVARAAEFDQAARSALPEASRAGSQPSEATPARDLFAQPAVPGTGLKAWSAFEVEVEQVRSVKLPRGRIGRPEDAAYAFRALNRSPRERFQMIGVNAKGKPIAFYDLFSGTITQTSVYPREVWTVLYGTPGVKGVYFAHNHPSGLASPSSADELLTRDLRTFLYGEHGISFIDHLILAGDRAYSMEQGYAFDIPKGEPAITTSVPVLERVMKRADQPVDALTSPGASRDYIRRHIPKDAEGVILMDAQHRVIGWWPMKPGAALGSLGTVAEVMQQIGRANPAAALVVTKEGRDADAIAAHVRMLKDVLERAEVKLLDAFTHAGSGHLVSLAERGLMEEGAGYDTTLREPGLFSLADAPERMTMHQWRRFAEERQKAEPDNAAWQRLLDWIRLQDQVFPDSRRTLPVARARVEAAMQGRKPGMFSLGYSIPQREAGEHPNAVEWEIKDHPVAKAMGTRLHVVRRAWDLPYKAIEQAMAKHAMGIVRGYTDAETGHVYLVAENLRAGQAEEVLIHEAVGHAGIIGILPREAGKDFQAAMLDIYGSRAGAIRAAVNGGFLKDYAFDLRNVNHQTVAAMEYVAHLAERGEEQGLWDKMIAAIRAALRKLGLVREWSDNDIQRLLAISRASLKNLTEDSYNGLPIWQLGERGPLWYSALERAADKLTLGKATPEQWLKTLRQRPGVKADEIFWSGLEEWMQAHSVVLQGKPIPKQDVLVYLRMNGVQVAERLLGGVETGDIEMRRLLEERDRLVVELDAEGFDVEWHQDGRLESLYNRQTLDQHYVDPRAADAQYNLMPGEADSLGSLTSGIRRRAQRLAEIAPLTAQFGNADVQGNTRYSHWKLPGGQDYRELLITLPKPLSTAPFRPRPGVEPGFQSAHFDEPNILAHVRFDTRRDADGRRVLFIEEIQSDWAERGRRHGFFREARIENVVRVPVPAGAVEVTVATQERPLKLWFSDTANPDAQPFPGWGYTERLAKQDAVERINAPIERSVKPPQAPFVTSTQQWTALVLKRAIRWAADHGFDRVAWASGEQQNERYSLEKHIGRLVVQHSETPGRYLVRAWRANDSLPVLERGAAPDELDGLIGKELAERAIADLEGKQGVEYKGLDLRVGGEPMRAYYDKMLPNIANDLLAKLGGARVGVVKIADMTILPREPRDYARHFEPHVTTDQLGFDITPQMREVALQGLPLFQLRDQKGLDRVYGLRDGVLLGVAERPYGKGAWNVYLAEGTNETLFERGQFRRLQAGSIAEVQRIFNTNGLELQVIKPRNIPVPDRAIFDTDWVAPQADNWLRRSIIYFQNRLLLPELYESAIERQVGVIPEEAKAHREARIAHPRAAGKIADFEHDYMEPIVELMKAHKLTLKEVGEYLYARHAPERNAAIAEINPENPAGSGMTDERAASIMQGLRDQYGSRFAYLEQIGALADRINFFREEVMIDKGLVKREAVELLRAKYKHYVPLKELPDDEFVRGETGAGFRVNKLLHSAFGRFTEAQAQYILPGLISQAKGTIAAGENAEVLRAFLRLVEYAPNPEVWNIKRDEFKPRLDRDTGMVVWAPRKASSRNMISVPVDGERVNVEVADQKLANAFNTSGAHLPEALSWIGAITRFYASMATAANPEFVMTNLMRDFQEAMIRVGGEKGTELAAKAAKDLPAAFWGAFSGLRAKGQYTPGESAKPGAEVWHAWYRRYIEAGGHIAYRGIQDAESQHKDFLVRLAEMGIYPEQASTLEGLSARAKRAARLTGASYVTHLVADINGAVENATRLTVFKNAVEMGMNDKDAAMLARNATVDFNLKGEATGIYNALYMFFNANVQGSALLLRSVLRLKGVREAALWLIALGAVLDWWNRGYADKDESGRSHYDNISEDIKQRNLVIMGPDKKNAILIPLPFGFGIFHNIGRNIMSAVPKDHGGAGKGAVDAARDTFVAAVNAFSPFGNVPTSWLGMVQLVSPTVLDPFVQAWTNRNWMDKPIYPERRFGKPQAKSETYYTGTPEHYVRAAEFLNDASGGNEVRSGWADMYPNVMQHWVTSVFGSAGATYSRIAGFIGAEAAGKEVETREIPFLRRFYYEPKDFELSHRFYQYVNQSEVAHFEMETNDPNQRAALADEHRAERELFGASQLAERQVAGISRQIAVIRHDKRLEAEQKKALIEKENEARRQVMLRFTTQFELRQGQLER